jgi:hypothetical protein
LIASDTLWATSSQDEIELAVKQLERDLMIKLFQMTFVVCEEDNELNKMLNQRATQITTNDLLIPHKYQHQAPWELAQKGKFVHFIPLRLKSS